MEFTTEPAASISLGIDGSTSTITSVATDPDGFPITYSYDTNPANPNQITSVVNNNNGSFTLTPSTNSAHAGDFIFRSKANDGLKTISKSTTVNLSFTFTSIAAAYAANIGAGLATFQISGVNNNQPFTARYSPHGGKGWIEVLFSTSGDRSHVHGGTNGGSYVSSERWFNSSGSGWDNSKSHTMQYMKSHRNTVATMGPGATTTGGLDYTAVSSFMMLGPNANATDIAFTSKDSATQNGTTSLPVGNQNQNSAYPLLASANTDGDNVNTRTKLVGYFTGNRQGMWKTAGWTNSGVTLSIALSSRDDTSYSGDHWGIATGYNGTGTYWMNLGSVSYTHLTLPTNREV